MSSSRWQAQILRAEGHLLVHPGAEELGLEILEEQAHPAGQLPGAGLLGVGTGHLHPALKLALDEPGDEALETEGQGGFAGLARPQHGEALPGLDRKTQPGKDRLGRLLIAEVQVGDGDDGFGYRQKTS